MEPSKKDLDLTVNYFELEDPLEEKKEGEVKETENTYCQFEATLERATFDALKTEVEADLKPDS